MAEITISKCTAEDIDEAMAVFDTARRFMRSQGNMTQWVNGYPSRQRIKADVEAGNLYAGRDSEGDIVMVFAFIVGDDPTYSVIEDGNWLNNRPYGTIHRLASSGKIGGVLEACVDFCFSKIDNLRLDTHRDNAAMLAGVERLGFSRCGIIYCDDGTPRVAFQKTVS